MEPRRANCIREASASGCALLDRVLPASCDRAVRGTVSMGQACSFDDECDGDSFCDFPTSSAVCPIGTCQPRVSSNGACDEDSECVAGLKCFNGSCRAPAGANAPCRGVDGVECASGLFCDVDTAGQPGTCRTLEEYFAAGDGDACAPPPEGGPLCASGLSCAVQSVSPRSYRCEARVAAGAACSFSLPDQCPPDQGCDADISQGEIEGTCVPLPTDGQRCLNGRCAADHRCVVELPAAIAFCERINRSGGACATDKDCYSGNCVSGTCELAQLCTM